MRIVVVLLLVFCVGCLTDSVGPESKEYAGDVASTTTVPFPPGFKGATLSSISSHTPRIFEASKDTWWENISGQDTSLCTSDDGIWAKYENLTGSP